MRHVILDTDIGTDVDDLLALVFLAKAPELCLEGITTAISVCMEQDRRGHLVRIDNSAGQINTAYALDVHGAEKLLLNYILR